MSAKIIVSGRLGRDSELKYTPNGTAILSANIAVDTGFGDRKKTSWYSMTLFGARAEKLQEYFSKGTKLLLYGIPQIDVYDKQDGTKGTVVKIVVDEFEFIGCKNDQQG